ncbi:hypothetical protein HanHA300_Chr01g0019841 [Helianthus annuus]|nr:hypothetical protein HanHA300_Chr01g0019841 [Helianthus annuus]KAJ0957156.1 hypothetical protein HanPSC8_Chr01g0023941 [Helianthus annuus]
MFATRTKITNLEAHVKELKKSEVGYKEKYEEAKSHRERVEVDLFAQIISKDRDLAGKDAEIVELNRCLREAQEGLEAERQKNESMEIDLTAEKVKADTAEEAHKIANSILNAMELNKAVVALTMAARETGHRLGYVECAAYVEESLQQHFGTRHCSVNDQAEEGLLRAEENYDNLSLPVMDLVTETLKHDDYVSRLKSNFEPPETVQLTDDEEEVNDDGAE